MNFSKPKNFTSIASVFFLLNTLYFTHSTAIAQSGETANSSPYSRYGLGDINARGYGQSFAMGGATIAMQNDTTQMFFINNGNPASYSNFKLTTAELGANFYRVQLQSSTTKQTLNNASLGYVSFAFPIKKWWGASIGLIPFSSVGYNVSDQQNITNVGTVNYLYQGSGGINQVYLGNGIKPLYGLPHMFLLSKKYVDLKAAGKKAKIDRILKRKKSWQALSLGANVSYLFGSFDNTQRSIFPSTLFAFNTRTGTTTRMQGLYLDYGLQYAFTIDSVRGRRLKDNVKIMIGATFSAATNINTKIDSLSYSYFNNSLGYEIPKDTIQNTQNSKGSVTIPMSFGFGIGFKKGDRWTVAADFAMQNWSSYKVFNENQGLKNSMRLSLGVQYVPNSKANNSGGYPKRMNYRMGIRYAQTSLDLKNTPLVEYAASAGIGFPVGRSFILHNFSMVNIGIEVGQTGTTTNGLIKENFMKGTIGFTINDLWFQKPKFD